MLTIGKKDETWGVTLEFKIKYKKPIPLDEEVRVIARLVDENKRFFKGIGKIVLPDGDIAAEAEGKYLKLPIEKIADFDKESNEWRVVESEADPDSIEIQNFQYMSYLCMSLNKSFNHFINMVKNKKFKIVGIGEILWDMLPQGKKLGGAPANFVYYEIGRAHV